MIRLGSIVFLLLGPMGCLLVFGELVRKIYHHLAGYMRLDLSQSSDYFGLYLLVFAPFGLGLLTLATSSIRAKNKKNKNIWVFRAAEITACSLISLLLADQLYAFIISAVTITIRAAILEKWSPLSLGYSVFLSASSAFAIASASLLPTIYIDQHYAIRLVASLVLYRIFMNSGAMQRVAIERMAK